MSDEVKLPDHQEIEEAVMGKPVDLLSRMPDCTETRSAARNLDQVKDYMFQVVEREQAKRIRRQE